MARFCGRVMVALWLLAHAAVIVRAVRGAGRLRAEVAAFRGYCPRHSRD